jgi:DNA-directed RNA polymerase subunit RPC12/RpoP
MANCERCGAIVKDHNQWFYRCPNCALLKKKDGAVVEWGGGKAN